jgi:hypothetical protein
LKECEKSGLLQFKALTRVFQTNEPSQNLCYPVLVLSQIYVK